MSSSTTERRLGGFSLLELALVLIIVGVLAAFVSPVLTAAVSSYDTTSRNVEVLTKMRYTMERLAREIREMRRDPSSALNFDIITGGMTSSTLDFCKADNTRVTITYANPNVTLAYKSPTDPCNTGGTSTSALLTDSVASGTGTDFCFGYCRADGTTCTLTPGTCTSAGGSVDKTNVRFVDITMTLTGTDTGNYTSTMRVGLRDP